MAVSWYFKDESTERTNGVRAMLNSHRAIVPPIWSTEVANVLALAEKKGRGNQVLRVEWLEIVSELPIEVVPFTTSEVFECVLPLAIKESLTVYDALYLDLALRQSIALATLDGPLAAAAVRNGIRIL